MTRPKARPVFGRKMTTMRIDQPTLEFCASNFKSASGGAGWLAEWAANALARALPKALARLDKMERFVLVNIHKGYVLNPQQVTPEILALLVKNDSVFSVLPEKWDYDAIALAAKCDSMTTTESAAVAVWACAYWTAGHYERVSPEEYANG